MRRVADLSLHTLTGFSRMSKSLEARVFVGEMDLDADVKDLTKMSLRMSRLQAAMVEMHAISTSALVQRIAEEISSRKISPASSPRVSTLS